jgi:hypothetical protein
MYYFTRLSHIVDGFILTTGMWVCVVCTHTCTCLPDGYMMLPIYIPAGRNIISYPSPYRVKPVGYSGFGYPLTSLVQHLVRVRMAPTVRAACTQLLLYKNEKVATRIKEQHMQHCEIR